MVIFGISNVEDFCCAQAPVARGVQVDANAPSRDLRNIKYKRTDSPIKNLRHTTASTCCLCRTAVLGNDSFTKMFVHYYKEHCVLKAIGVTWGDGGKCPPVLFLPKNSFLRGGGY